VRSYQPLPNTWTFTLSLLWAAGAAVSCASAPAAAPAAAGSPAPSVAAASPPTVAAPPPAAAAAPTSVTCQTSGRGVRGDVGQEFQLACPAGCDAGGEVRGTFAYTGSSPVCRAAIHAGAIPPTGGIVTVRIDAGRRAYRGTVRNGIKSLDDGSYPTGFSVLGAGLPPEAATAIDPGRIEAGCTMSARGLRGDVGASYVVWCPPGCASVQAPIVGTGEYAFDSSICRAAIHAGLVNDSDGGAVKVLPDNAHPPYRGSAHNGIRSNDAPTAMGSFRLQAP
jgi:hypothetical protein